MPYVPQTTGTYDTLYQNLAIAQCRGCHGSDLSGAHHEDTPLGCADCHADPDTPLGDCLACHTQEEARTTSATLRRGHHVTTDAGAGLCTTCHDPALVTEYGSVPPPTGPLSPTAPCPENCRTCHKATKALTPPLAALDGAGTGNLHHGPQGEVVTPLKCDYCHDTTLPHYDQRQIRVCANCHPHALLHAVHPSGACLGCHTRLSKLVYIISAHTTDAAGNPTSEFAPGEPVLFHLVYDVVGTAGKKYPVKTLVKAFGQKLTRKDVRLPGRGYEVVFTKNVPSALAPGTVRSILYKPTMLQAGVVVSTDKATSKVRVVAP
jgi:hypothetical protein